MAIYAEEEEAWKCPKHPSKQRPRNGICPNCLRDRLITLCPDCANVRPCGCCAAITTPSSSSTSSSSRSAGIGPTGRLSSLIDGEPTFRRSRSVAIPFLRSRLVGDRDYAVKNAPATGNRISSSIWSVFRTHKNKKGEEEDDDYGQRMVMRSRSVSVPLVSNSGTGDARLSAKKGRSWYFASPIKVFRQSKTSKVVQERSPLHRG